MTSAFIHDQFLLENSYAEELYHGFAKDLPIIDYHNHLPPDEIAQNKQFDNLTQIWLKGDHYKWRAMRANGIDEQYITGEKSDWEKFLYWSTTVPYTVRNPLYHWTHLELVRYFDVYDLLDTDNAKEIYDHCNALLQTEGFKVNGLLEKMSVEIVCTTDDPLDDLSHHSQIHQSENHISVYPAFRPDKIILIDRPDFVQYCTKLADVSNTPIHNFDDLLLALKQRVTFFHERQCRLSDHGLERINFNVTGGIQVDQIFRKRISGKVLTHEESQAYQSAVLHELGLMYHDKGWTQQFHLGALRNTNTRLLSTLGPDTGFDSIGDFEHAKGLSAYLDSLDRLNRLPKTILYNLNPRDNEVFATMVGNYNDGSVAGKMQYGSAWWFLDQLDGMEKQMNALSNTGLISRFVGMLTDSRSFLSFPRHEYFRRLLCNMFGKDISKGYLPKDIDWIGKVIQDISYYNAKDYFKFP